MKLKHVLSLLSLAVCAVASTSALAQSTGTININGYVSPVSCTPQLTGGAISGNTLILPDAFISDFTAAGPGAGGAAAGTPFSFDLSGCATSGAIDYMWVHFSGGNIDGNGRITPTSGTNNIRFELLNGPGGSVIEAGGTAAAQPVATQGTAAQFSGTNPSRSATKTYAVRYYAQQALAMGDVGAVTSAVTYNVRYY